MKKNRVIIFDFDGVIVNSIEVSFEINKETVIDLEFSEWQSWFEGNIYKNIRQEFSSEEYQIQYFEKYSNKLIDLLPVKGIENVLKKLISMGFILIINSSSSGSGVNNFLKKHDLKKYFAEVMTREVHKSKVEKFKIILEKYKIKADQTVIVTDTVGDVKEAREVGIKSIGTSWGAHEPERLIKNGVDFMAEKPEDILVGIKKILV